jgi:hypothetical protein
MIELNPALPRHDRCRSTSAKCVTVNAVPLANMRTSSAPDRCQQLLKRECLEFGATLGLACRRLL